MLDNEDSQPDKETSAESLQETNTTPQRDIETDLLAVKLDAFTRSFRREIVDLFTTSKATWQDRLQAENENNMNQLKHKLVRFENNNKRMSECIRRTIDLLHRNRLELRYRGAVCRCFMRWKEVARQARLIHHGLEVAGRRGGGRERRAVRHAFSIWRGVTIKEYREKVRVEFETKLKEDKQEVFYEANIQNRHLAERLLALEAALAAEKSVRNHLEGSISAALQRVPHTVPLC